MNDLNTSFDGEETKAKYQDVLADKFNSESYSKLKK